jgi:hypothetical protein
MNRSTHKRKCQHCREFFVPDYRNVGRQRYCSTPFCKQASKADSQRHWRQKPENHDYFRGPDNVKRVQLWRQVHPGYWRRPTPKASEAPDALQETLTPQEAPTQSVSEPLEAPPQNALQDSFFLQPAVFVGLIAQLTGVALQDDIAAMVRRLQQLGRDILDRSPPLTGGDFNEQTPDFSHPPAPRAAAVQLGGSALGP